jgi:IstB-like ATP binding protein
MLCVSRRLSPVLTPPEGFGVLNHRTTNLSFKQWGTVFPGAACVVALIDRFSHHCDVVDIDADFWRKRHALSRATLPDDPPAPIRAQ